MPAQLASKRFELVRALGAGGMGVVHLAWDQERRMQVALKTLQGADPANLARLKNEFRALADIAHPNLAALYELFAEDGAWFFTMEAVEGVPFDAWCARAPRLDEPDLLVTTRVQARDRTRDLRRRAHARTPRDRDHEADERDDDDGDRADAYDPSGPALRAPYPVADLERLRVATRGLLDAVEALHRAGKLHCDLKPSNVLVEREGRVVVLDFGLVKERPRDPDELSASLEGTPEYVAPEVVRGLAPAFASDWYQVGVMLFQAIAGRPPFTGSHHVGTLLAKLESDAPRVSTLVEDVPGDLDALIVALLERDPAARAGGGAIRAWLEGAGSRERAVEITGASVAPGSTSPEPLATEPPFIGRAREQALLAAELARAAAGEPRHVLVRGTSGIGKSALIRRFADAEERAGRAVVLAARCYEREQVPFKALDGVVDAITARLLRMPGSEVAEIVPESAGALALLFPVLGAVDAIAAFPVPDVDTLAPGEVLGRAAEAARTILQRWSERAPIVIVIDDLQWGDADSAAFVARVIDPSSRSRVLLLASARTGDSPVLRAMSEASRGRLTEIELGPLDPDESTALARSMLDASDASVERAQAIATDAAGVPFFVTELARHARTPSPSGAPDHDRPGGVPRAAIASVDEAILARATDLDAPARTLLELSAIAGVPIAAATLARAAGSPADPLPLVRLLGARSLIRSAASDARAIEPYHDRVREVIAARLPDARREALHLALGEVLAGEVSSDPEQIAHHLARGGDRARALPHQVRAAERASRALAFDRAVSLYEQAIALAEAAGDPRAGELSIAHAEALVLAGRARDAAPIFLACAEQASGAERTRLERRAAEEWLKCGRIDEGVAVLRRVLAEVGLRYPDAQVEALARALVRIVRIRRLDGRFVAREEASLPRGTLARVDAARAAGVGLMMVDPLRGYGFLARFLLDAVDAGEPRRVAAGLCLNAVTLCRGGEAGYPRAKQWLDAARAIAERDDDTYLRGLADACEAGASVTTGRWAAGARLGLSAPSLLRSTGTPATWEITASVSLGRTSLYALGRLAELRVHTAKHLRDAEDVGDLFAATYARVHAWVFAAMDGDPARGRAELEEALARWSRLGFHAMHFWRLYGELMYDLYQGAPLRGLDRLRAARPALQRSRILAMQFYDAFLGATEAALELDAAASSAIRSDRDARVGRALAIATRLESMRRPYADGLASHARARAEALRGRDRDAVALLERAIEGFAASEMALHRAASESMRGALLGGDEGGRMVREAHALASAEGVADPARFLAMLGAGARR